MSGPAALPASFLRRWGAVPGPGEPWLEALAPLQYVAYPVHDVQGRPLGEANAPPDLLVGVPLDLRPCPYADSRAGLTMNATPLTVVRQHWPWVLESVSMLRQAWSGRHPRTPDPIDLPHLWGFAAVATALPIFLLRTGGATDGTVQPEVAALFKVMQGVFVAAWGLWAADPGRVAPIDADAVTDAIVADGALHNSVNGRVCPGPEPMIRELVESCLRTPADREVVGGAGALLGYGSAYAALTLEKWLVNEPSGPMTGAVTRYRDELVGWEAAPASPEERITELQRAVCRAVGVRPPTDRFELRWIPPGPVTG